MATYISKRSTKSSGVVSEADDYAESNMSSQRVTCVATPVYNGRKRNASEPRTSESTARRPVLQLRQSSLYINMCLQ